MPRKGSQATIVFDVFALAKRIRIAVLKNVAIKIAKKIALSKAD
jgi:hypothetical protein